MLLCVKIYEFDVIYFRKNCYLCANNMTCLAMVKQRYIRLISCLLLAIYAFVAVEQSVAILLCDCQQHHHEHHCCHDKQCEQHDHAVWSADCRCEHDHSAEVKLYVDSREAGDWLLRRLSQMVQISLDVEPVECGDVEGQKVEYQEFIPLILCGGECNISALRAPPVLA